MLMMRRWVCGQPPPDATKLYVTLEGVSTNPPAAPLVFRYVTLCPVASVKPACELARRGAAAMSLPIP
jgi:hypothetical protein